MSSPSKSTQDNYLLIQTDNDSSGNSQHGSSSSKSKTTDANGQGTSEQGTSEQGTSGQGTSGQGASGQGASGQGTTEKDASGNHANGNNPNSPKQIMNKLNSLDLHGIFLLILIVSCNFLTNLFPCGVQKFLTNNIYAKNFFGYLSMIFFVVLSSSTTDFTIKNVIVEPFILYLGFMVITKVNITFFMIIVSMLFLIYLLSLKKKSIKTNIGKKGAKQLTPKELKIFTDLDLFLNVTCIFTIIIGVLVYIGQKKYELGNKFTILKYLIGDMDCDTAPVLPKLKATDYLKHVFD